MPTSTLRKNENTRRIHPNESWRVHEDCSHVLHGDSKHRGPGNTHRFFRNHGDRRSSDVPNHGLPEDMIVHYCNGPCEKDDDKKGGGENPLDYVHTGREAGDGVFEEGAPVNKDGRMYQNHRGSHEEADHGSHAEANHNCTMLDSMVKKGSYGGAPR